MRSASLRPARGGGRAGGRAVRARGRRPGRRGRDRSRQPAASRVRRPRRPVRGRGRPRRHATAASTGGEGPACMGATGAVTKIDRHGRKSRVASGLASYANEPGNENAIGPHGIAVLRHRHRARDQRRSDRADGVDDGADRPRGAGRRRTATRTCSAASSLIGSASAARSRSPTPGRSSATSTRTRRQRPSTPTRSTSRSTACACRAPTPAATRSTRSTSRPRLEPRACSRTVRTCRRRSAGHGEHAGRADVGRDRPGRQYYVSQLTGFPFPVGGAQHLPRQPARRHAAGRGVPRLHRRSWTWRSRRTARCTCSRSTTTASSSTARRRGRDLGDLAQRPAAAASRARRRICRSPAASRSARTASMSRRTPAHPAAAR